MLSGFGELFVVFSRSMSLSLYVKECGAWEASLSSEAVKLQIEK